MKWNWQQGNELAFSYLYHLFFGKSLTQDSWKFGVLANLGLRLLVGVGAMHGELFWTQCGYFPLFATGHQVHKANTTGTAIFMRLNAEDLLRYASKEDSLNSEFRLFFTAELQRAQRNAWL